MLDKLFEQRKNKADGHARAWAYYDSEARPRWLNKALDDFFKDNRNYIQNWIAVIVDAITDRLIIDGFTAGDNEAAEEALGEIWDRFGLEEHAAQVHQDVAVTGEGFMLYEEGDNGPVISRQEPGYMAALYEDGADPERMTATAKFYVADGKRRAIVWTEQTIDYYVGPNEKDIASESTDYTLEDSRANDYGAIPVFHFRRTMRRVSPDFDKVIPLQDSLNKAFILLGMVVERAARNVSWIAGGDDRDIPELHPGDVIGLPIDGKMGQLAGDDPAKMLAVIDNISLAMASISRTPRHYFSAADAQAPSGEALQAMESPLIRKVEGYHTRLSPAWTRLIGFAARQSGVAVENANISVTWRNPRTTLVISQAMARKTNVDAGIPLRFQLREEGYRENELDLLLIDREAERPVELDEAALEQMYAQVTQRTERIIEPAVASAIQSIADAALDEVTKPGRLERITRAIQQQQGAES